MPETANHKIPIRLNLLKPQSEAPKNIFKFFHWVLFAGRYIIVIVEVIVLAAFLARFKLDADIANTQERIDEQADYIRSLKNVENEVRKTQFQLSNIRSLKGTVPDFANLLKHIADHTPSAITLTNMTVESAEGVATIKIAGDAKDNNEIAAFTKSLKGDDFLSEVSLSSISLEQNSLKFVITARAAKKT